MPCNSDYMEPTQAEINSKITAQNLIYVYRCLGNKVPGKYIEAAKHFYGDVSNLNNMVVELCAIIRGLTSTQLNEIVYDGRKKESRQLADWWEEHDAADRKREIEEYNKEREKELYEQAKAKLTGEEYYAIKKGLKTK